MIAHLCQRLLESAQRLRRKHDIRQRALRGDCFDDAPRSAAGEQRQEGTAHKRFIIAELLPASNARQGVPSDNGAHVRQPSASFAK